MANDNRRFQRGTAVYLCGICRKKTRETGECESGCGLCRSCYEAEGLRNEHNDSGHPEPIEGCPECEEEFTFATRKEARGLPTQVGEDGEKLVECPKCKKFVASWGGQARPEPKGTGDTQVVQP